jgi:biopolymer transport protein ExbB
MLGFFYKGGPIMSPLLVLSVVALTVALERLIFIAREKARRSAADVDEMLTQVERGDLDAAANMGITSRDFVARARVCAHAPRAAVQRGDAALGKLGSEAL